jgi:hypothetical protein
MMQLGWPNNTPVATLAFVHDMEGGVIASHPAEMSYKLDVGFTLFTTSITRSCDLYDSAKG